MDAGVVGRYFRSQLKSFRKNYRELGKKMDEEVIHDFRVALKKIRFILSLTARYNSSTDFKKLYKPFKKVFKEAGLIRDMDIRRQLLSKYFSAKTTRSIVKDLQKEEEKAYTKLLKKSSGYKQEIKKAGRSAEKKIQQLGEISEEFYASELLGEMKSCFQDHLHEEELHPSRKLLKEITYASKLSAALDGRLRHASLFPEKLKVLEKEIGSWHDQILFGEWLKQDETAQRFNLPEMKRAREKLNRSSQARLKTIHSRILRLKALHS